MHDTQMLLGKRWKNRFVSAAGAKKFPLSLLPPLLQYILLGKIPFFLFIDYNWSRARQGEINGNWFEHCVLTRNRSGEKIPIFSIRFICPHLDYYHYSPAFFVFYCRRTRLITFVMKEKCKFVTRESEKFLENQTWNKDGFFYKFYTRMIFFSSSN